MSKKKKLYKNSKHQLVDYCKQENASVHTCVIAKNYAFQLFIHLCIAYIGFTRAYICDYTGILHS